MWIVLGVLAAIIMLGAGIYNRLIGLRNRSLNAWADIDVQLKKRHNLVANLVETVKGYAKHESETLENVVRARNAAITARGNDDARETGRAEGQLGMALRQIFALSERYPDLKADGQFSMLQGSLSDLEAAIEKARRYYNAVVRDYNTRIQSVPDVFLARVMGFEERDFFELTDERERSVPQVDFGTGS